MAWSGAKYNENRAALHTDIEMFPKNIAASLFGFQPQRRLFQAETSAKEAPKVSSSPPAVRRARNRVAAARVGADQFHPQLVAQSTPCWPWMSSFRRRPQARTKTPSAYHRSPRVKVSRCGCASATQRCACHDATAGDSESVGMLRPDRRYGQAGSSAEHRT